jgi:membrane protein
MPLAGNQADSLLSSLVEDRGLFGLIGSVGLIWAATRLFGSLRTVLEVVFEIPPEDRLGIVEGKIHDVRMVIIVGTLFVATISLTTGLQWVEDYGIPFLGLEAYDLSRVTAFGSMLMAFSITYLMFYFVYRYVPDRWIPRTDAAIAALFSSLLFELAKQVFIAYLSNFGRLMQFYGSFTNLVVVAFWVYYSSIVFMLGGELARIVQVHRRKGVQPTWGLCDHVGVVWRKSMRGRGSAASRSWAIVLFPLQRSRTQSSPRAVVLFPGVSGTSLIDVSF